MSAERRSLTNLMEIISLELIRGSLRLLLVGVKLSIEKKHWLRGVLGMLWESVVPLSDVEAEDYQS